MADPIAGARGLAALGDGLRETLRLVVAEAERLGERLHWVGGGVRDYLLGRPSDDLDLVLEAAPERLLVVGTGLARRLGGRLDEHLEFLTCRILAPGRGRVDVACSRRERYPVRGGLPLVEAAGLTEDLGRRDFTINALALEIAPYLSGVPIDPHGGLDDLDAGVLRILYPGSFVDDPTRIVRGASFEARLGFRLEAATEIAAREAIAAGAVESVSGARLWRTLDKGLAGEGAPDFLLRLADLGLLAGLSRALGFDRAAAARLRSARELLEEVSGGPTPDSGAALALPLLGAGLSPDERRCLAGRLDLPRRARESLVLGLERSEAAVASLAGVTRRSVAHRALAGLDLPELALAGALQAEAARWVREEIAVLRPFKLQIDGEALKRAGAKEGPELGAALDRTRAARLDGEIEVDEEMTYARDFLIRRGG